VYNLAHELQVKGFAPRINQLSFGVLFLTVMGWVEVGTPWKNEPLAKFYEMVNAAQVDQRRNHNRDSSTSPNSVHIGATGGQIIYPGYFTILFHIIAGNANKRLIGH
jgi:hypothetical protein